MSRSPKKPRKPAFTVTGGPFLVSERAILFDEEGRAWLIDPDLPIVREIEIGKACG